MAENTTWFERLGEVLTASAEGRADVDTADAQLAALQLEVESSAPGKVSSALCDVLGFRVGLLLDAGRHERARLLVERRVALAEILVQSAAGGAVVSLIDQARVATALGQREVARASVERLFTQHGHYVATYASPELGEVMSKLAEGLAPEHGA